MKRGGTKSVIKGGIGNNLWKISITLYLVAEGILAVLKNNASGFKAMFLGIGLNNDTIVVFAGIIALAAGVAILLEMFKVELPFLSTLIFIVAIIWAVYVIVVIFGWLKTGIGEGPAIWIKFLNLAIQLMVLSSLMIASRRFD